jgi:hypothetical protein
MAVELGADRVEAARLDGVEAAIQVPRLGQQQLRLLELDRAHESPVLVEGLAILAGHPGQERQEPTRVGDPVRSDCPRRAGRGGCQQQQKAAGLEAGEVRHGTRF